MFLVGAVAGLVSACTYSGQIDQPYTQKATWFSYVNGDDVRKRCANIEDHWEVRLIYNGHYERQVRSYHLTADGIGGADVTARASPQNAGSLTLLRGSDPLAPWRWRKSTDRLDADQRAELESQLADSGVYDRAPEGLRLKSWGWYWVSIACRDGEIWYNAWMYPSDRWDRQRLRQIVQPLDDTGVAFNTPRRPVIEDDPATSGPKGDSRNLHFRLRTGENGLAHVYTPF